MDTTEETGETARSADELARDARAYRWLDLVVAAFFLLLGLIILEQVWTELPLVRMRQVGPGMLPLGVGCILVATSLLLIWQNLRGSGVIPDLAMPTPMEGGRVAAVVVMLILTILLIPVLGTMVALALFIFLELKAVERRSLLLSASTAILIPLFIYASFEALLGVALPVGILGLR